MVSLYQKVGPEWVGTHRISLRSAIEAGKRSVEAGYKVAIVPDGAFAKPILDWVESL